MLGFPVECNRVKGQNSERGIETAKRLEEKKKRGTGVKGQNSERGIETRPQRRRGLTVSQSVKGQNSERGIETCDLQAWQILVQVVSKARIPSVEGRTR